MRKLLNALTFTGFSALGMIASSAQAGVVLFQDGFDTDFGTSSLNFTSFNNWDVSNGSVDFIRSPNEWGIACVTGCVDLDGSTNNGGRITSKSVFSFLASHTYKISVDVSGNQRADTMESLAFGITGNLSAININAGNFFTTYTTEISSFAGLASLIFETSSNDNVGAILDNVAFECTTCAVSAVPEPGIFGLFALGLAALGLTRKRKAAQLA